MKNTEQAVRRALPLWPSQSNQWAHARGGTYVQTRQNLAIGEVAPLVLGVSQAPAPFEVARIMAWAGWTGSST